MGQISVEVAVFRRLSIFCGTKGEWRYKFHELLGGWNGEWPRLQKSLSTKVKCSLFDQTQNLGCNSRHKSQISETGAKFSIVDLQIDKSNFYSHFVPKNTVQFYNIETLVKIFCQIETVTT